MYLEFGYFLLVNGAIPPVWARQWFRPADTTLRSSLMIPIARISVEGKRSKYYHYELQYY